MYATRRNEICFGPTSALLPLFLFTSGCSSRGQHRPLPTKFSLQRCLLAIASHAVSNFSRAIGLASHSKCQPVWITAKEAQPFPMRLSNMKPEHADNQSHPHWKAYNDGFERIIESDVQIELLLENPNYPFAHEAGVFIASTNELFITSNRICNRSGKPKVQISKVCLDTRPVCHVEIDCDSIQMGNGGVNYQDGILFCAQGSLNAPSGLYKMSISPPYQTEEVLTSFYGRPFNSLNDVVVHQDGSIWFTDPVYGFEQGYRPKPQLPNQVYRFEPKSRSIRAMADGLERPNGICFSPNEETVYITDTDWIHGDGSIDGCRSATIYAFDVSYYHDQPFLVNRKLFAMTDAPIPDGIKCDVQGNVYSGCGDGVHVWSPGGVLLGKILIEGGVANFCFGRNGELFMLNEKRLWRAQLSRDTRGALLRI